MSERMEWVSPDSPIEIECGKISSIRIGKQNSIDIISIGNARYQITERDADEKMVRKMAVNVIGNNQCLVTGYQIPLNKADKVSEKLQQVLEEMMERFLSGE